MTTAPANRHRHAFIGMDDNRTLPARFFSGYDIFVMMNISSSGTPFEDLSRLLALIGQPARIQILTVIGSHEACVCHLEAVLGIRQASISQHLMVLRKAKLVTTSRQGRNIFYRLARPEIIEILKQAAAVAGIQPEALQELARLPVQNCLCPYCNPDIDPSLTCGNIHPKSRRKPPTAFPKNTDET